MDSLSGTSLHEKAKFCTFLQCQKLGKRVLTKKTTEKISPADLQISFLKSLSVLNHAHIKKINHFDTKLKTTEDVSSSEKTMLEVKIRFISQDATSFLYSMQEKQETVTRPQL